MTKKITLLFLILATVFTTKAQISKSTNANLTKNRNVTDWLHYDTNPDVNLGNPNADFTLGVYIKLTSNLLAPHVGRQIEELKFHIGDLNLINGDLEIRFYSDLNSPPVYTQTVAHDDLTGQDWNTIILTNPYQIASTQDLYVGYYISVNAGFIAGVDDGSAFVENVNYFVFNGTIHENGSVGIARNFNIRAGIGGAIAQNDAGISSIAIEDIILAGNHEIKGVLTNYGSSTLNSIDINYKVENNNTVTETLTGLNLATGQTLDYSFNTQWNATTGTHNLDVWTSNFNGNGNDDTPGNDHVTKTIKVASQSVQNLPLYEEFTSSTCAPCANFNSTYFNTAFFNANTGKFSLIKYQMNWPGQGDAYYTEEGGVRRAYYGVSGVPQLYLNGKEGTHFDSEQLQTDLDEAYNKPAYFDLSAHYTIDDLHNISVSVNIDPYLNANYTLHCVVVEKTTTENTGNNGETEFHNVMMKMVPDANGTVADMAIGQTLTMDLQASLDGTNIEEYNDLEVIVFLQDDDTKKVMQSAKAIDDGAVDNQIIKTVNIYPNPAINSINITGAKNLDIEIMNVSGAIILSRKNISDTENINVSNLAAGVYFIKFKQNNKYGMKKLIITK